MVGPPGAGCSTRGSERVEDVADLIESSATPIAAREDRRVHHRSGQGHLFGYPVKACVVPLADPDQLAVHGSANHRVDQPSRWCHVPVTDDVEDGRLPAAA